MSCVTCDGAGLINPPEGGEWLLTGKEPMKCPVCQGPHIQWLVDKTERENQVIICSAEDCEVEIHVGWIVYAQMTTSNLPELDEAILLCCDEHAEKETQFLKDDGHPTVCLPFCFQDAKETV